MFRKTQRSYTNKVTGELFFLYENTDTHQLKLINKDGNEIKAFYICPFANVEVRMKDKTIYHLNNGEFLDITNEKPTHKRLPMQIKFSKF